MKKNKFPQTIMSIHNKAINVTEINKKEYKTRRIQKEKMEEDTNLIRRMKDLIHLLIILEGVISKIILVRLIDLLIYLILFNRYELKSIGSWLNLGRNH